MSSIERLKRKLKKLEELEDELLAKTTRLRKDLINEADSEAKYKLEKLIEKYEGELEDIDEEIENLENQIRKSQKPDSSTLATSATSQNLGVLHTALLSLGFQEQQRSFEEIVFARKRFYGNFLIQGCSRDHGQRWLLNRLALRATKSLGSLGGKRIKIDLSRRSSKSDVLSIWRELSDWVDLPEDSSISKIVDRLCKLWKSQNVFIVFNNVDESVKENLNDLIFDFWLEISQELSKHESSSNIPYKFLIFFLDYQGVAMRWNIGFSEDLNSDLSSEASIALPTIEAFSHELLREWIDSQKNWGCFPSIISDNSEGIAKQIFLERKGIPEPTIRKVCSLCSCNWYSQEEQWLPL